MQLKLFYNLSYSKILNNLMQSQTIQNQPSNNNNNSSDYAKHMWSYCYTFNGKRAIRNQKSLGWYPIALCKQMSKNTKSTFSLKTKTANGQVRFGIAAKKMIHQNCWTRDMFIFLDVNQSGTVKKSCISYNIKPVKDIEFVGNGEMQLTMQVDLNKSLIIWYKDSKVLAQVEIPKCMVMQCPLSPYFALRNSNDWCELTQK